MPIPTELVGSLPRPMRLQEAYADHDEGKITFAMSFQGSNGSMQIGFTGALKDNGTLAGTLDFGGQGQTLNWTAERAKEA